METYGFLKFGTREHMMALLREGHMFCNTVGYFQGHEHDRLRGDPWEGISHAWRMSTHQIYLANQLIHDPEGRIDIAPSEELRKNLYCLYAVRTQTTFIDQRNLKFGDTCIFIRDPPEFMRRVAVAIMHSTPRGCHELKYGPVTYVSRKTHDGKVGPFTKFDSFAYQNEVRFVISPGQGRPLGFSIGSIEDIAEWVHAADANRLFRFPEVG